MFNVNITNSRSSLLTRAIKARKHVCYCSAQTSKSKQSDWRDLQQARVVQHLNDFADGSELFERDVEPEIEGESELWSNLLSRNLLNVYKRLQQCLKIEWNIMVHLVLTWPVEAIRWWRVIQQPILTWSCFCCCDWSLHFSSISLKSFMLNVAIEKRKCLCVQKLIDAVGSSRWRSSQSSIVFKRTWKSENKVSRF